MRAKPVPKSKYFIPWIPEYQFQLIQQVTYGTSHGKGQSVPRDLEQKGQGLTILMTPLSKYRNENVPSRYDYDLMIRIPITGSGFRQSKLIHMTSNL